MRRYLFLLLLFNIEAHSYAYVVCNTTGHGKYGLLLLSRCWGMWRYFRIQYTQFPFFQIRGWHGRQRALFWAHTLVTETWFGRLLRSGLRCRDALRTRENPSFLRRMRATVFLRILSCSICGSGFRGNQRIRFLRGRRSRSVGSCRDTDTISVLDSDITLWYIRAFHSKAATNKYMTLR